MTIDNKNQPHPTKTTYYFEEGNNVIVEITSNEPTLFPEKLARVNELLKKIKFMTPEELKEAARQQAIYRMNYLNDRKKHG